MQFCQFERTNLSLLPPPTAHLTHPRATQSISTYSSRIFYTISTDIYDKRPLNQRFEKIKFSILRFFNDFESFSQFSRSDNFRQIFHFKFFAIFRMFVKTRIFENFLLFHSQ